MRYRGGNLKFSHLVRDAPVPGEWTERASCRNVEPDRPEAERMALFFPSKGVHVADWFREMCAACPVLRQCRDYALTYPVCGWWGGMGEKERLAIRREHRRAS